MAPWYYSQIAKKNEKRGACANRASEAHKNQTGPILSVYLHIAKKNLKSIHPFLRFPGNKHLFRYRWKKIRKRRASANCASEALENRCHQERTVYEISSISYCNFSNYSKKTITRKGPRTEPPRSASEAPVLLPSGVQMRTCVNYRCTKFRLYRTVTFWTIANNRKRLSEREPRDWSTWKSNQTLIQCILTQIKKNSSTHSRDFLWTQTHTYTQPSLNFIKR